MFVKNLSLKNFRNYSEEYFEFDSGINIICGENAQGKTNLVEALYYMSIGKSFKNTKEQELIFFGKDFSQIIVNIEKNIGEITLEADLSKKTKKILKVNGSNLSRTGDLLGNLVTVFFCPDDLKLIKEAPQDRRRFMDICLSQLSKKYFNLLERYNIILKNRNDLLKSKDSEVIESTIPIWNEQLADTGKEIIYQRLKFIEILDKHCKKIHQYLTDDTEKINIKYYGINSENKEEIKKSILEKLNENFEKDLANGHTSTGPHRDDLIISINGLDIKNFGSQGQQRTTALSLKLAEKEILKEKIGEYPITILDDVFSELDSNRVNKLLSILKTGQTFITTTASVENYNSIKITNGKKEE